MILVMRQSLSAMMRPIPDLMLRSCTFNTPNVKARTTTTPSNTSHFFLHAQITRDVTTFKHTLNTAQKYRLPEVLPAADEDTEARLNYEDSKNSQVHIVHNFGDLIGRRDFDNIQVEYQFHDDEKYVECDG